MTKSVNATLPWQSDGKFFCKKNLADGRKIDNINGKHD
jgi:hypothetical protein